MSFQFTFVMAIKATMEHTNEEELAKQLWAIGDHARLRILALLPHNEDCQGGNNVSQIAEKLGLAQPTVSHHLRVLRQAGIVENRKMCRDVFYWVNPEEASHILSALESVLTIRPPIED